MRRPSGSVRFAGSGGCFCHAVWAWARACAALAGDGLGHGETTCYVLFVFVERVRLLGLCLTRQLEMEERCGRFADLSHRGADWRLRLRFWRLQHPIPARIRKHPSAIALDNGHWALLVYYNLDLSVLYPQTAPKVPIQHSSRLIEEHMRQPMLPYRSQNQTQRNHAICPARWKIGPNAVLHAAEPYMVDPAVVSQGHCAV